MPLDRIAVGDCIAAMQSWPASTVDLIFADPPYNIGFKYDDHYVDNRSDEDYIAWTQQWISAAARLLKPTGSFYILIGDEYAAETRLHLKQLEKEGKLAFRNWIIWHYTFGQRCKVKFNRSHAHLFYCVGSAALEAKDLANNPPFAFNRREVSLPSARMTTYNDSRQHPEGKLPDDTWYLRYSLPDDTWYLPNFPAAADWFTRPQEAQQADESFFEADSDTWAVARLCGTFKEREGWHPCQLPEALLERIVRLSSNEGEVVFDPFAGSGTTLAVAHRLGRQWLGCELGENYARLAEKRIRAAASAEPQPKVVVPQADSAAKAPKPRKRRAVKSGLF